MTRRDFVRRAAVGGVSASLLGCGSSEPVGEATARATTAWATMATAADDLPEAWREAAGLAIAELRKLGVTYGDVRLLATRRQTVSGEDGRIALVRDEDESGIGVRALHGGAWGFAATCILTPEETLHAARLAVEIAKGSASFARDPVTLAPEPVHEDSVVTARRVDPFAVPLERKAALLLEAMEVMHAEPGIQRSNASLWAQRDLKLFASTEGTRIGFDLLAVNGEVGATAVHEGRFASRTFMTPYLRAGFEIVEDAGLVREAARVAREAVEKVKAPQADAGVYDLVLDPAHLALTIHESCGHPTELDRALGYEANYAGTSFLTPEKLGHFRYGSKHVSLVADNTEPGTLAATGYDDDGVLCQRWDIIREGVFVGYSTSREVAPRIGAARSRGSSRADSWSSIPIVRIANVGLEPGEARLEDLIGDVERGIYIEGRGSFSIDQKRYNFQFGGDAFWLIEKGRRTHMLRDVIYHGITPEFWSRCDAVAGRAHRGRFGFITCGKGQPGQSGWMTHPSPPALFRKVDVIRGEALI
jgi:TldD protein